MSSPPLSSPPRPLACSSGQCVRSRIQAPRPWSRSAGSSTFRSFARALGHPGAADNPRRTLLAVVPSPCVQLSGLRTTRRRLRATPRQATTPGRPSLRALTRVPSCATRARRELQTTPAGPNGSAFPLKTGSAFLLGPSLRMLCSCDRRHALQSYLQIYSVSKEGTAG